MYVSNLRKALGDGLLVTRGRGYLLQAEACQVDSDRFEALVAEGRATLQAGDGRGAAERLGEALALWRGPPLADLAYERFAQAEIARLEEARLEALEDRIDADLAVGELAGLVGELEGLVDEYPLRERLQGQLMLALYRSGRQADALERYREAREGRWSSSSGSSRARACRSSSGRSWPTTRRLNRRSERPGPRRSAARRMGRGGWLIAAAGLVLLAAIAAAAMKLSGSGAGSVRVPANSVAVIDPRTNSVVARRRWGAARARLRLAQGRCGSRTSDDQTVSRIDPGSLRTLRT